MDPHVPHNLPNSTPFSTGVPLESGEVCASGRVPSWRATWLALSVLSLANDPASAPNFVAPTLAWSGSFAQISGGGLFDEDPRTWAAPGWNAVESACRTLHPAPGMLLLRPHARHVISDIPSCRRLLDGEWAHEMGIGLILDPAAMCAPSMLAAGRAQDHLRRIYEAIELLPRREVGGLSAIIVGVPAPIGLPTPPSDADPLGRLILDLAKAHIPPGLPTLLPA